MSAKDRPAPEPPRWALRLAGLRAPRDQQEFVAGDLAEEFANRYREQGAAAARGWLARHLLRCLIGRHPGRWELDVPTRRGDVMSRLWQDIVFGLRLVRKAPLLSAVAVLTFALGIGANAAIFSVAWPVLAGPLAFPDEDRLAIVLLRNDRATPPKPNPISPGDYFDLLGAESFESMAGFNLYTQPLNLTGRGEPRQLELGTVTEDFFRVLRITPLLGRGLDTADFGSQSRTLVLTERSWREDFGADPSVVGQTATLDGEPWTVIGVMPTAATVGTVDVDGWLPENLSRAGAREQRSYYLSIVGRLGPGISLAEANAELDAIMARVAREHPETNEGISAQAESLRERLTGPVRPMLLLLLGSAGLVLVLAGINLSGLQIARNLARGQELGVRRALGAERGRLLCQLAVETLVLAALGGGAGLIAAAATLAVLRPTVAWHQAGASLAPASVAFAVVLTLLVGAIVGLGPGLLASRTAGLGGRRARGGTASRASTRLRTALLGAQIATSMVLLIAASLSGASLIRLIEVDPGFELEQGLIADLGSPSQGSSRIRFFDELVEGVEGLPGVERACAISKVPLDNDGAWMTYVAEGATDADRVAALPIGITSGCLEALGIELLQGRAFERTETMGVALVSESAAHELWPDDPSPLGRKVHIGLVSGPLLEVVGIVRDIRATSLESAGSMQLWTSASRGWPAPERLIVRTTGPSAPLAGPLRELLRELDPDLALSNLRTMRDIVGEATASRRFVLVLLAAFALIALVLSAVGIYGVLAHQVGQRTREIGVRLALGARRQAVARTIAGNVLAGVASGIALGVVLAWMLSSLLATQLFEMSATDPRAYLGVAGFVSVVAAAASWLPTRRATRVDPVEALRSE
ncbi:MAG TPA: ADOP family duplicated permease [Thermoanaerobaculia bacterium]|nr:ADOP family duplicated permease [Thermoanaerobaculia bacterium]